MVHSRFFPATIRSEVIEIEGVELDLKNELCGAEDLRRVFQWAEINGVRRVVQIRYVSDALNDKLPSPVALSRDFYYHATYPFDLYSVEDTVVAI